MGMQKSIILAFEKKNNEEGYRLLRTSIIEICLNSSLLYIGIVCVSQQCVFASRQLSFHCHVDVDGMEGIFLGMLRSKIMNSAMDLRLTDTVKLSFHLWFGVIQYLVFPVCLHSRGYISGLVRCSV